MTVRVTTLKGAEAGCYYVERLPRYYLDANEPRGRWVGTAAVDLGLAGELDDAGFLAVMDGCDPNDPTATSAERTAANRFAGST